MHTHILSFQDFWIWKIQTLFSSKDDILIAFNSTSVSGKTSGTYTFYKENLWRQVKCSDWRCLMANKKFGTIWKRTCFFFTITNNKKQYSMLQSFTERKKTFTKISYSFNVAEFDIHCVYFRYWINEKYFGNNTTNNLADFSKELLRMKN